MKPEELKIGSVVFAKDFGPGRVVSIDSTGQQQAKLARDGAVQSVPMDRLAPIKLTAPMLKELGFIKMDSKRGPAYAHPALAGTLREFRGEFWLYEDVGLMSSPVIRIASLHELQNAMYGDSRQDIDCGY